MIDVNVQLLDFHVTSASEMVCPNEDGSYTVFLNSRMDTETLRKAFDHAMSHIEHEDFKKNNVQMIEYHAHNINA